MAIADVLFLPWPSWAKLGFVRAGGFSHDRLTDFYKVLGGLLVVVGTIATVAKIMKWRRLLRLERNVGVHQAERGEIAVETTISLPFGVKGLDDGSSIEGVWNAHTATPLHGPRTRNTSPLIQASRFLKRSKRDASVSSIPSLDIGEPSSIAPPAEIRIPSPPRLEAPEPLSSTEPRRKKANSITINYSGPSARAKVATLNASTEQHHLLQSETAPSSSISTEASTPPIVTKYKLRTSPKKEPASRKFVIGGRVSIGKPDSSQIDTGDVIRRMEAHRRLHSAESGQLVPKIRPKSEDNARVTIDYCSYEEGDVSSRTVSWPTGDGMRIGTQPSSKPKTISQPHLQPRVAILESKSPVSKQCPSAWTSKTQEMLDDQLIRHVSVTNSLGDTPSLCSETTISTAVTSNEIGPIENKSVRKVNDGFEILPAGTFATEHELKAPKVETIALNDDTNIDRKQKRLKKHRRSSSVSSRGSQSSVESHHSARFALLNLVY